LCLLIIKLQDSSVGEGLWGSGLRSDDCSLLKLFVFGLPEADFSDCLERGQLCVMSVVSHLSQDI